MNMVNECKSCGSVRFKQITPKVFECEYCGRKICNSVYFLLSIASIGNIVVDPTRTMTLLPSPNYSKL